MKKQLLFIAIFIFTLICNVLSQTDTIYCKNGKVLTGTITLINDQNIFYSTKKGVGEYIGISNVKLYSKGGKRQEIVLTKTVSKEPVKQPVSTGQFYSKAPIQIDTVLMSDEMNFMKDCLRKHSKEYYLGVGVLSTGLVISFLGAAIVSNDQSQEGSTAIIVGGIISLIGGIIMIDSHKWITKAGLGITGKGNAIGIYYKFK